MSQLTYHEFVSSINIPRFQSSFIALKLARGILVILVLCLITSATFTTQPSTANVVAAIPVFSPTVIDFETLPDGASTTDGMSISDHFASLGVIFPFAPVIKESSGIARSGTKVLITDSLTKEFNQAPLVIRFTSPQQRVKVWVGQTQIQHFAQKAILRVFDSEIGGSMLAKDIKLLSASPVGAEAKADIALEVKLTGSRIRRAEILYVRASDELTSGTFEAIDDLEFEGALPPPPPCPSTEVPAVVISRPANGELFVINEFLLEGSITTASSLRSANLTIISSSGNRTLDLLSRGVVSINGGSFATRVNDLLFDGANTITISAQNCKGTAQTSKGVTFSPESGIPSTTPLIFIPGVAGSRIDEVGGENIWPHRSLRVDKLKELTLDPDKATEMANLFVSDVIRKEEVDVPCWFDQDTEIYKPLLNMLTDTGRGGFREYQGNAIPGRLTTDGCDLTQRPSNPTLFVFPYDWRKSSVENAVALNDYTGCIRRFYPNSKVNILAHSMGGLIAKRYILDNPGTHNVDKLVTIGAPWLGAPRSGYVMETGEFISGVNDLPCDSDAILQEFKSLMEFFPGAHQLLPSSSFFSSRSAFKEDGWDINGNGNASETYSYNQFTDLMNSRFRSSPGTTGQVFHDKPGQDDWRGDNFGISYFHIIGRKPRPTTPGQVVARQRTSCLIDRHCAFGVCVGPFSCKTNQFFDLELTDGDGTVPLVSSKRDQGEDLNAPGALSKVFSDFDENKVEHTGMTKNPVIHDSILSFLSSMRATKPVAAQEPLPALLPARYIKIFGATSVTVTDAFGNSTNQAKDIPSSYVPGVTTFNMGASSRLVIVPTDQEYTVTFRSGTDPLAIEIKEGTDVTTSRIIRYQDLSLPAGRVSMLKVNAQGIGTMRLDGDGDGGFETEITPTVDLSGPATGDVTPPKVRIQAVVKPTSTLVTLIAEDNSSGVHDVFYSSDGNTYQVYTAPFSLSPVQSPVLRVFADDNVANRSSNFTFAMPPIVRPSNVLAATLPGQSSVVVNYNTPTAKLPNATVICSPPSGSSFPIGITNVLCTASDPLGNVATGSFAVLVNQVYLQDESNGFGLSVNPTTGDYQFFSCDSSGFILNGRGTVSVRGCSLTLQHVSSDRRVQASIDTCLSKGTASLQLLSPSKAITITDRDTNSKTLPCP